MLESSALKVLQDDSTFLPIKKSFPLVASPDLIESDTLKVDRKKVFIESQISTKAVEPSKKKQSSKATNDKIVQVDSSLLNTELKIDSSQFRFNDIIKSAPKVQTAKPKTEITILPFFKDHELLSKNERGVTLNKDSSVWIFFVLLVIVCGFAWIRVFYSKTIKQLLNAIVNMTATNQMVRDENLLLQRASVLLTVMFNLVAALFLYEISIVFEWSSDFIGTGFGRFLIFALCISFLYSIKFIVLKVSGHIFRADKAIAGYIFNIFLINNILGIALLPLIIGLTFLPAEYTKITAIIAISMVVLGYVYRILRGLFIGIGHIEFSRFHLFLYLCTLEIAPILVFIKLIN